MREKHPYGEYIPNKPKVMIIGSFPIAKFTDPKRRHEIKEHEFDFFFGGEKNLLWKLLGKVFSLPVSSREDLIALLEKKGLAVGDVIRSCKRKGGRASDSDLYDIEWNMDLLKVIEKNKIKKIFFTSRKVEGWFHRLFPEAKNLETIVLISPSGQSVRALGYRDDFREWLKSHPGENRVNFILEDYRKKFETIS